MELSGFILLGILVVVVIYAVMLYNNRVSLKHNVGQAWANIDDLYLVQLPDRGTTALRHALPMGHH
ncbi:MAG: hypothetical protein ACE5GZ_02350 [Gammaproteobacteria bacterium]